MLIGELSKKTGFSRDTIRYYEKLGLISAPRRAGIFNNYKNYTTPVLKRLLAIRQIKDYGFTLKETQAMLVLFEEGVLEHERGNRYIQRKIALIDNKIRELEAVKEKLQGILLTGNSKEQCAIGKILTDMAAADAGRLGH